MRNFLPDALVLAGWAALTTLAAAAPVFKCTIQGTVTYQSVPCPSGPPGRQPTLDQLNAAEKLKRERQVSESRARAPVASTPAVVSSPGTAPGELPGRSSRCDGRTHCSQMTSCAEAKYFLSNCPGVKMDGDGDGIPCEEQWCGAALR